MEYIKKYVDDFLAFLVKSPYWIIKKVKKRPEEFYLINACRTTTNSGMETSFRLSPDKAAPDFKDKLQVSCPSFAIVLQGPLRLENHFTLETVVFYKSIYPLSKIIVSTWEDENQQELEKIKEAGAEVVLCQKPKTGGHLNINYQLVNSREGILYASKQNVAYIAKTRTDQRIQKPFVFNFLIGLMEKYPSDSKKLQKKRIVTLSMNYGNLFFPYFMSDFFYFGSAYDMCRLFSVPNNEVNPFTMPVNSTRREYSKSEYAPEVYIMKNYLKLLGCSGDATVKDYWDGVKKFLICVDLKLLDIKWPKYEGKYKLHEYYGDYFPDDTADKNKTLNFDFITWCNLYDDYLVYDPKYERNADVVFK